MHPSRQISLGDLKSIYPTIYLQYLSIYLSIYACVSTISIHASICLRKFIFEIYSILFDLSLPCILPSICPYLFTVSIHASICLPVIYLCKLLLDMNYLFTYHASLCLFIYLLFYPSIYIYLQYLSMHPSVCLCTILLDINYLSTYYASPPSIYPCICLSTVSTHASIYFYSSSSQCRLF